MPTLTLHFRRDFARNRAVVRVNGKRRYATDDLTTKLLLDLADTVPLRVRAGPARVSVTLVDLGRVAEETFSIDRDAHVEVWHLDGRLELRLTEGTPGTL
jgi:hypothetical protein